MSEKQMKLLLISANVGTLFENEEGILHFWKAAVLQTISTQCADFVAIHFQEIGGKRYESGMSNVVTFLRDLQADCVNLGYSHRSVAYLDDDYSTLEQFTALCNLYLVRNGSCSSVERCNYNGDAFESLPESFQIVHSRDIYTCPYVKKQRFNHDVPSPSSYTRGWSRKGYATTRWRLGGNLVDLINVHLFHEECNHIATTSSPSVYANDRQRGLRLALDDTQNGQSSRMLFIFGDFNFRLDQAKLLQWLIERFNLDPTPSEESDRILNYCSADTGNVVLRLGKKCFDLSMDLSDADLKLLQERFDIEAARFFPELREVAFAFPPTYPWSEEPSQAHELLRKRAPAWCDRVLMNPAAWSAVARSTDAPHSGAIGLDGCTGDHKPVYLSCTFPMKE